MASKWKFRLVSFQYIQWQNALQNLSEICQIVLLTGEMINASIMCHVETMMVGYYSMHPNWKLKTTLLVKMYTVNWFQHINISVSAWEMSMKNGDLLNHLRTVRDLVIRGS